MSRLLRLFAAEPSTGVKVLSRLLALLLVAGARRVRARYAWDRRWINVQMRGRYRVLQVLHPLHVRLGISADVVNCQCDRRSRPATPDSVRVALVRAGL